jgi:hypothetical protein
LLAGLEDLVHLAHRVGEKRSLIVLEYQLVEVVDLGLLGIEHHPAAFDHQVSGLGILPDLELVLCV